MCFYDRCIMKIVNKVSFLFALIMSLQETVFCAAGPGEMSSEFDDNHQSSNPSSFSKVSAISQKNYTSGGASNFSLKDCMEGFESPSSSSDSKLDSSPATSLNVNLLQNFCDTKLFDNKKSPTSVASIEDGSLFTDESNGINISLDKKLSSFAGKTSAGFGSYTEDDFNLLEKSLLSSSVGQVVSPVASPVSKLGRKPTPQESHQANIKACNKCLMVLAKFLTPPKKLKKINVELFSNTDAYYMNKLNEKELNDFHAAFNFIKSSPCQRSIMQSIVMKHAKLATDNEGDLVDRNDKLLDYYAKVLHIINFIKKNKAFLSDKTISSASAVDVSHIMKADIQRDLHGKITKVTGGHTRECYMEKGVRLWDEKGIVGFDESVMGVKFSGGHDKTINKRISPEKIVSNLQQGKVIATAAVDKMNISKVSSNKFVGSFVSSANPLCVATQFPILTVSEENLYRDGKLLVGSLVKFRKDGVVKHKSPRKLLIYQSEFDKIMNDPALKEFTQIDQGFVVKDITQFLETRYSKELNEFGVKKIPSRIYGVKEIK